MNPLFSIIIPTYNRLPVLKQTISMYELQQDIDFPFEMIIVDDGSTDGTWDYLSAYAPSNFILSPHRQANRGPAQARNLAITHARGEYLLITGDDIIPAPTLLAKHVAAYQAYPDILAVLGRIVWHPDLPLGSVMKHIDGVGGQQFGYHLLTDKARLDFKYFYTSNISLVRAELMKLDRLFDADFTYAAFEDIDFAYRLFGKSEAIMYRADILGYHHHTHTLESFSQRQYFAGRMASIFVLKHPELKDIVKFREVRKAIGLALSHTSSIQLETLQKFEALMIEKMGAYNESDDDWLDNMYYGIFEYFYCKGFVEEHFNCKELLSILTSLITIYLSTPLTGYLGRPDSRFSQEQREFLIKFLADCPPMTDEFYMSHRNVLGRIKSLLKNLYSRSIQFINYNSPEVTRSLHLRCNWFLSASNRIEDLS